MSKEVGFKGTMTHDSLVEANPSLNDLITKMIANITPPKTAIVYCNWSVASWTLCAVGE